MNSNYKITMIELDKFEVYALLTLEYKVPIILVDMEKEKV